MSFSIYLYALMGPNSLEYKIKLQWYCWTTTSIVCLFQETTMPTLDNKPYAFSQYLGHSSDWKTAGNSLDFKSIKDSSLCVFYNWKMKMLIPIRIWVFIPIRHFLLFNYFCQIYHKIPWPMTKIPWLLAIFSFSMTFPWFFHDHFHIPGFPGFPVSVGTLY